MSADCRTQSYHTCCSRTASYNTVISFSDDHMEPVLSGLEVQAEEIGQAAHCQIAFSTHLRTVIGAD
jgi:hypothetical protein